MENWIWLGGGAVIGWLATQFGVLARDVIRRMLLKRAVVSELRQLNEESQRVWTNLARSLQVQSLGGIYPALPLPLSNSVYSSHYVDAMLVLTRVQRTAIELVHKYVAEVNSGIEELRLIIEVLNDEYCQGAGLNRGRFERFGHKLQSTMGNAAEIIWLSNYYLRRPELPVLEKEGPDLEDYQIYVDSYRDELKSIVASVKGLTLADFERAYRPVPPPNLEGK